MVGGGEEEKTKIKSEMKSTHYISYNRNTKDD
jgi:hypothetical protein